MELLIVRYPWGIFNILLNDKKQLIELQTSDIDTTDIGTIYVGKVEQVKKNINSAFVRISDGRKVFVSLQEDQPIYYAKKMGKVKPLVQGDEILVQIEKEAHKTKLAKGASAFTLSGRYAVLTTDKTKIFVSSKMTDQQRLDFKSKLRSYTTNDYGFIIRTNAQHVALEKVIEELESLAETYKSVTGHLAYKQVYQVVYRPEPKYLSMIRDLGNEEELTITVCEEALAREIEMYLESHAIKGRVQLIKDTTSEALLNAYSIKDKVKKLLMPKVWLKSGATIVIEPTEAMTVIDVNTERTLSRKASDETILRTNLEAADMIMTHMRARNISGIIIIDFIDMKTQAHRTQLSQYLEGLCKQASLKTTLHGMTTLGLMEMTRKKLEKPIWENPLIQRLLDL